MKIRTNFVSNSSSSSFVLILNRNNINEKSLGLLKLFLLDFSYKDYDHDTEYIEDKDGYKMYNIINDLDSTQRDKLNKFTDDYMCFTNYGVDFNEHNLWNGIDMFLSFINEEDFIYLTKEM